MKVDGGIPNIISKAGAQAAELEKTGYSGGWTAETSHDPFLPLVPAAEATSDLELGTSIAVAFARNPMTLANTAWDLQMASQGRFILGLGSQIKPHITKRFSMEWSHPAARMREMILAIRAIWDNVGERHQARLPRRLLHPHADDPVLLAGQGRPRRLRRAEDLPGRRRRADDRGRRRGLRRLPVPRLHDREVPARGHAAGARAGPGEGRQDDGRLRHRRARASSSPAPTTSSSSRPPPAPASRSPSTARRRRTSRSSRSTAGAACRRSSTACRSRASG